MITGNYWLDAVLWSIGGGAVGRLLGTELRRTWKVRR